MLDKVVSNCSVVVYFSRFIFIVFVFFIEFCFIFMKFCSIFIEFYGCEEYKGVRSTRG